MKPMDEIRDRKNGVIEDMRAALVHTADREADLLAFMEQYQKAIPELRPAILEHLRSCMDGKPYPNPYACGYTREQVEQCDRLLEDCFSRLESGAADARTCVREVTEQLRALNAATGGQLIDGWRQDRLAAVIEGAAALAGHSLVAGPVLRQG